MAFAVGIEDLNVRSQQFPRSYWEEAVGHSPGRRVHRPRFPSIHYAIFLAQNVNILATSPAQGSVEERLPDPQATSSL